MAVGRKVCVFLFAILHGVYIEHFKNVNVVISYIYNKFNNEEIIYLYVRELKLYSTKTFFNTNKNNIYFLTINKKNHINDQLYQNMVIQSINEDSLIVISAK